MSVAAMAQRQQVAEPETTSLPTAAVPWSLCWRALRVYRRILPPGRWQNTQHYAWCVVCEGSVSRSLKISIAPVGPTTRLAPSWRLPSCLRIQLTQPSTHTREHSAGKPPSPSPRTTHCPLARTDPDVRRRRITLATTHRPYPASWHDSHLPNRTIAAAHPGAYPPNIAAKMHIDDPLPPPTDDHTIGAPCLGSFTTDNADNTSTPTVYNHSRHRNTQARLSRRISPSSSTDAQATTSTVWHY